MFQLRRALFFAHVVGAAAVGIAVLRLSLISWLTAYAAILLLPLFEALAWYARRLDMHRNVNGFVRPTLRAAATEAATTISLGLVAGIFAGLMAAGVQAVLRIVEDPASRIYAFPGVSATAVLFSGVVLFFIRRRYRASYGTVEVGVGIAVAMIQSVDRISVSTLVDSHFVFALVTAGVYLVVRGLDNIEQGLEKTPEDVTARFFRRVTTRGAKT